MIRKFCIAFVLIFVVVVCISVVLPTVFPGAGFEALADPIGNHGGPF